MNLPDVRMPAEAELTDSELSRRAIAGTLDGKFLFAKGLGWMAWDGKRWIADGDAEARYAVDLYLRQLVAVRVTTMNYKQAAELIAFLSKTKVKAVTDMAADNPAIRRDAADFDADPHLLNTPGGVVDLRTGELLEHDPGRLMTKITRGSYRPGYRHPDWEKGLEALAAPERKWYQTRVGQGITGHPTPDGVTPILQGGGENGKTLLTTDGLVPALGDYADMASSKLIAASSPGRSEHSTERADLRGQRLLIGEELSEGRSLNITALKQIQDVSYIKARYTHKDNITFAASHSLFATTNYIPIVNETDHGTWRRLALLKFPYSFKKSKEECTRAADRIGDPTIKRRIKEGNDGQHDAIVTWAVEGARRWYADPENSLRPTARIEADTRRWRMQADRILGFWAECIIADAGTGDGPAPCVLADDMTEAFNIWLKGNGHEAWSRETFAPRFGEHQETTRHGVESRRTAKLTAVSRRPRVTQYETLKPTPKQATVWTRVRFRTEADQREDAELAQVAQSPTNDSRLIDVKDLSGPVQPVQVPFPPSPRAGSGIAEYRPPTRLQSVTVPDSWPAGSIGAAAS